MSESAKLAEVQYRKDEKKAESESVNYPDWIYRAVRQRPLLVLFHLDIKRANIDLDDHAILPDASVVAWSISFPKSSRPEDRKSVVEGKSVSVRVDLGGRRIIKNKTTYKNEKHT